MNCDCQIWLKITSDWAVVVVVVVNVVLTSFSDDPSSNPAEVFFYKISFEKTEKEQKEAG